MSVLILSSHVAASRVGGGAQAAALERMGLDTILVPTVLFGRHPGLGAPGGAAVPQEILEGVIAGVEASGALAGVTAMICGYFATAAQAAAGVRLIGAVRAASPGARILIDPIMGDTASGLYVREEVAEALARDLAPRADVTAPNAWELARLTGRPVGDLAEARAAARALGKMALVSSIPLGEEIGVLLAAPEGDVVARHARAAGDPKGAGDLLTAVFVGALVKGLAPEEALGAAAAEAAALAFGRATDITVERLDD